MPKKLRDVLDRRSCLLSYLSYKGIGWPPMARDLNGRYSREIAEAQKLEREANDLLSTAISEEEADA